MIGRNVLNQNISVENGVNTYPLNVSEIQNGTYFVKMIDEEGEMLLEKFIKIE